MALPLDGLQVLALAINIPAPLAAARLHALGARVTKVEPPGGDPLAAASPSWYEALCVGHQVMRLDLKVATERRRFDRMLAEADLLLTANSPAALDRLGLGWPELHARHPQLCHVAIVGFPGEESDRPGHDLTYQARAGLLRPPELPVTLLADLAGAERAVSAALALLLARARAGKGSHAEVALADAAEEYAQPFRHGLTTPGDVLGGGLPLYNLYRARQGWVAVALIEAHFRATFEQALGLHQPTAVDLERLFQTRTAQQWEAWAVAQGLPILAVREHPPRTQKGHGS